MHPLLSKYLAKFFIQQWVIGLGKYRPEEMLGHRRFDPQLKWIEVQSPERFIADPFLLRAGNGKYAILYEDYTFKEGYGHLALLEINDHLQLGNATQLLNTGSHLSYPFVYRENDHTYIIPEAAQSGKLSCYQWDATSRTIVWVKDLIHEPLLDATIFKKDSVYWMFATRLGSGEDRKLEIFFADQFLGPYTPHPVNPVKDNLQGSRPAGAVLEYNGNLFRPAQDSRYTYGGGLVINKIDTLTKATFSESLYMQIKPDENSRRKEGIKGMHTLNFLDGYVVTDGTRWRFSPLVKLRQQWLKLKIKKNKVSG